MREILLIQAAATLAMVGLIWFVQIVHYPLMAQVGRDSFAHYEASHTARTTWVVAPLMLVLPVARPSSWNRRGRSAAIRGG